MTTTPKHPPRRSTRAFTFVELMASLIIFALVATASTYLLAASAKTQNAVQNGSTSESEIGFSIQRITENTRAATALSFTATTITLTSPPSPLIANNPFTINYSLVGSNLYELYTYTNAGNTVTYSNGIIAHNVSTFTPAALSGNPNALQITIKAGAPNTTPISRTFVAFARNL